MTGKKAEMLIDTTKGKDMKKGFTLIVCFSREWCIHNFFASFNHLKIDMKNCHLLVIDNSDMTTVRDGLLKKINIYKDAFYTCRLYKTWRMGGRELITQDNADWNVGKLPYIYEMHKDFLRLCSTDNFVLLEDDTLPPYKTRPDVVMFMLEELEKRPKCAVYTAIETGRSSIPYAKVRLGIHYIHRVGNKILWRFSPNPKMRGAHKVDACGWYCCAARKDAWAKAFEGMDDYIGDVPRFAMDVVHINNIVLNGWDVIADFSLWCAHMNSMGKTIMFWGKRQARPQIDIWLPEWETYAQGVQLDAPKAAIIAKRIERACKARLDKG